LPKLVVRNRTRGTTLATEAAVANTSQTRRTGLLKHQSLPEGEGLWIKPCEAVHTFFMKFAIDVLYLDREKRVIKIRKEMGPWKMSCCFRASSVLELPAGMAEKTATVPGDILEFEKQ